MPIINQAMFMQQDDSIKFTHSIPGNNYKNDSLVIVLHDIFENENNPINIDLLRYASTEEYIFCDVLCLSLNPGNVFYQSTIKDKVDLVQKALDLYAKEYKFISIVSVGLSAIVALNVNHIKVDKLIFIKPIFNLDLFWKKTVKKTVKLGRVDVDIIPINNLTFIRGHDVIEKDLVDFSFSKVLATLKSIKIKSLLICEKMPENMIVPDGMVTKEVGDLQDFMNIAINTKLFALLFGFINGKSKMLKEEINQSRLVDNKPPASIKTKPKLGVGLVKKLPAKKQKA